MVKYQSDYSDWGRPVGPCWWAVSYIIRIITGRNEVVAKVIFLHLSVILFTGGVSASVHAGISHPPGSRHPQEQTPLGADTPREQTPSRSRQPPWEQTPPRSRHAPPEQTPPGADMTPPGSRQPPGADTPPRADTPGSRHPPPGADPPRFLYIFSALFWYINSFTNRIKISIVWVV